MGRLLCAMLLFCTVASAADRILTMGYRTNQKLPYINESPDNSGFYFDLYSEAARRIGYRLEVVRLPKKRVILGLQNGTIDFYPMFAFDHERTSYTSWLPAGITLQNAIVTGPKVKAITSFNDLKQLLQLVPLGNADYLAEAGYETALLKKVDVAEMGVERALKMLNAGHGDYFVYEMEILFYAIERSGLKNLRISTKLLPKTYRPYVGFSIHSPHFKGVVNRKYDPKKPLTVQNQPVFAVKGSLPDQFQMAIQQMIQDGTVRKLQIRYFGKPF